MRIWVLYGRSDTRSSGIATRAFQGRPGSSHAPVRDVSAGRRCSGGGTRTHNLRTKHAAWRAVDHGMVDADGTQVAPRTFGRVSYGATVATRLLGLGKESLQLGLGRGVLFAPETAEFVGDDPMPVLLAAARRLVEEVSSRRRLEEEADLSPNGLRDILAGRSKPWPRTLRSLWRATSELASDAIRQVDTFGPRPTDAYDVAFRYLAEVPAPERRCRWCGKGLAGRQRLWCSDAHRKLGTRYEQMPLPLSEFPIDLPDDL